MMKIFVRFIMLLLNSGFSPKLRIFHYFRGVQVSSNKIIDIRKFYRQQLADLYDEKEINSMLYLLFDSIAGLSKAQILINPEITISESQLLKIHFAIKDLMNFKPIQYILGETVFYDLELKVNPDVLIPRPETEELVEWILKESNSEKKKSIIDIGTGSGCIAITLKKHLPNFDITGVDNSAGALQLAAENADLNKVNVKFKLLDFTDQKQVNKLPSFDVIVSNPPYVRLSEKKMMKRNVLDYEPQSALFVADEDPLVFYESIVAFASDHLKPGGKVYCELNQYLAQETAEVFYHAGFIQVEVLHDINGNERMLKAMRVVED